MVLPACQVWATNLACGLELSSGSAKLRHHGSKHLECAGRFCPTRQTTAVAVAVAFVFLLLLPWLRRWWCWLWFLLWFCWWAAEFGQAVAKLRRRRCSASSSPTEMPGRTTEAFGAQHGIFNPGLRSHSWLGIAAPCRWPGASSALRARGASDAARRRAWRN